jgi:hypothetical protein
MKHVSDNYKHYPGAKKNLYCVVGFVSPSGCSRHEIEFQKTRKAALTMAHIHDLASQSHPGPSKHAQVTPARVHKSTSKSH